MSTTSPTEPVIDPSSDSALPRADAAIAGRTASEVQPNAGSGLSTAPFEADPDFVERIAIGFARRHEMLGFRGPDDRMRLGLANVNNWPMIDLCGRMFRRTVEPVAMSSEQLAAAINTAYQAREGQTEHLLESLDRSQILDELNEAGAKEDLLDDAHRAPVIKLVNLILFEAVKSRASDIHVQPAEEGVVVRFRIDGVLVDAFTVPKGIQEEVLSRIKVFGKMNIAEKRIPQDGRASVRVGDRLIDLRIASLPTSHGERIVIRLLDKSARAYSLSDLGMESGVLTRFRDLIGLEHGLILVTGPTGGGKSTTLYAALREINVKDLNVVTLEDPIEYQLDGVSQTQINEKKGLTFAGGLRNVLRQDPDIIMIGEIRDQETAVMAIQAALTGHMVFSTLHTNDAAGAVNRLLDLGIEPYLVASSLVAVLAQRLVRRICPQCSEAYSPSDDELRRLQGAVETVSITAFSRGVGCAACRQTGYSGRLGVFELLTIDDGIRTAIQNRSSAAVIREEARRRGMRLLADDGLEKIRELRTTIDEINRITMRTLL
jgi:general secretion pathway protein E